MDRATEILTLENVKELELEYYIGVISNREMEGRKYFKVIKTIDVILSNNDMITIPKGFTFDGSSSPRFLEWIMPRYGSFMVAALIHDWLYVADYKRDCLGLKESQKVADDEMYTWSKVVNNSNTWKRVDNYLRYKAVRLLGKSVYEKRSDEYNHCRDYE